MSKSIFPATVSTMVVLITGLLLTPLFEFRPLPTHMALHIGLMNVAAPLLAAVLVHKAGSGSGRAATLWLVAAVQIVLLWAWHAPALQQQAAYSHVLQWIMHGSLFLAALCFWHALLRLPPAARWQAIPVLLLTGKLACLLAALLIFAPRVLYTSPHADAAHWAITTLDDQQLAGLLMITACPLSYLVAGVVFAAQAIAAFGTASGTPRHMISSGRRVA
jgi:putative membrane protein